MLRKVIELMDTHKICARCNEEKPRTDFNTSKQHHDGLTPYCRDCRREYRHNHYLLSKEPDNAEARAYFERHLRPDLSTRTQKQCGRCGEEKPISEFNRMSSSADWRQAYCRRCNALNRRAYYAENREGENARNRAYYQSNRQVLRRYNEGYYARYPERVRAAGLVNYAVKSGELPQISTQRCAGCGQQATEYHHPDYSRPLDVVPLCHSCHKRVHVSVLQDGASIGGRRGELIGADARRRPG